MAALSTPTEWVQIDPKDVELTTSQLGGGGFAAVYRASFRGRGVAVKMAIVPSLSPEQLADFSNELMVLSRVQHPSVVTLVGANMHPPKPLLVMELCRGSLYDALHGARAAVFSATAPGRVRLLMALDVAASIAHLHGLSPSIVHRDIKSQNYLFATRAGRDTLVLADFGLVGHRAADAGTPAYLAPELWLGKPFGRPVDVYAFGVVLYELFSGRVPWPGMDAAGIRAAVLRGDRPDVDADARADVSAAARAVAVSCMQADAVARPTIGDAISRLREAAAKCDPAPAGRTGGGSAGGGSRAGAGGAAGADVLGAAVSSHSRSAVAGKAPR